MVPQDFRTALESMLAAFGVPATVTPPGWAAIDTVGAWSSVVTEDRPDGITGGRVEARRALGFPIRDVLDGVGEVIVARVPVLPTGTRIVAPEVLGVEPRTWRVEGTDRIDVDLRVVVVVPDDGEP